MPMCAAGPPNAVQPINMNARKMSPYDARETPAEACFSTSSSFLLSLLVLVVSVAFAMLIVVLINNYFKMKVIRQVGKKGG